MPSSVASALGRGSRTNLSFRVSIVEPQGWGCRRDNAIDFHYQWPHARGNISRLGEALSELPIRPVERREESRYQAQLARHHYLGELPKMGETVWYVAT